MYVAEILTKQQFYEISNKKDRFDLADNSLELLLLFSSDNSN